MCGSDQHGVTRTEINNRKTKDYIFICPLTDGETANEVSDTTSPSFQRCDINLYGLAKSIHFDLTKIPQIIQNYRTYGEGRFKSPETIRLVEERLQDICDTYGEQEPVKINVGKLLDDL